MNFDLPEELKILKEEAYKFAVREFIPLSKECDREEKFPRDVWKKACEYGFIGAWIPEEYGGTGAGFLANTIITEQFSRIDMGIGLITAACFGSENIFLRL